MSSQYALETSGIIKKFGGFVASNDVSLKVKYGSRHALIGPNGAGKTTLINVLTGILRADAGSIHLAGENITNFSSHKRVKKGLVRTFQINQLWPELTPLQSLAMVVGEQQGKGMRWWKSLGSDTKVTDYCEQILSEFNLYEVMNQRTKILPYGKQRLLEIAIAIALQPKVLLLDEPVAGVPEGERQEIFDSLKKLSSDVSIVLIEHDMELVFNFATYVTVLVNGGIFAEGDVQSISQDPRVKAVYLGQSYEPK